MKKLFFAGVTVIILAACNGAGSDKSLVKDTAKTGIDTSMINMKTENGSQDRTDTMK